MSVIVITPKPTTEYDDTWSWSDEERARWRRQMANKARTDPKTRPDAVWVARELVYWLTARDHRPAYYVVLRTPLGMDAAAVSPTRGNRVVRLLYEWSDIEPHLHLLPKQLSEQHLQQLASEGNTLRAAIRYARSGRSMTGGCR